VQIQKNENYNVVVNDMEMNEAAKKAAKKLRASTVAKS